MKFTNKRVEAKDPIVSACNTSVGKQYSGIGCELHLSNSPESAPNFFNHLMLSEYTDSVSNALPADLLDAVR